MYLRALLHVVKGVPHGPALRDLCGFRNELIVDAILHEGPRAGAAALPAVREGRRVRYLRRLLH